MLKQMWADWQSAREEKRAAAARRAQVEDCLKFALPPDQVVYAEAPAESARLLATAGRARVIRLHVNGSSGGGGLFGGGGGGGQPTAAEKLLPQSGWSDPAVLGRPEPMRRIQGRLGALAPEHDDDSLVFLHELKTPSGKPRLVWLSVDADQFLDEGTGDERAGVPHFIRTSRSLSAAVLDPDDLHSATFTTIYFLEPSDARSRVIFFRPDDGVLRVKPWEPRGLWRILAGQVDPADPTHVTIPYDVDGKPGVIDARLGDGDRLMFTPRTGRLGQWTDSNSYTWDLSAPPTTEPTK
jgi:hypothetical protein